MSAVSLPAGDGHHRLRAHDDGYLLDNRQAEAGTRFDALSRLFDPSTFRHIEELGIRICPDEYGPEQRLANKLRFGFRSLLAQRGADLGYGRKLPRLLREAGLIDVKADAFFPIASPA